MNNEIYLVVEKWRGNINVASMRVLDELEASKVAKELRNPNGWQLISEFQIYKVYPNKKPERLNRAGLEYLYGLP